MTTQLRKIVTNQIAENRRSDDLMRVAGEQARQARISEPVSKNLCGDLRKYGLFGRVDDRSRIEFGTVDHPDHGQLIVSHDRAGKLHIHGVEADLASIDRDMRDAVIASSAAFARAETDIEQTSQRAIVAAVVAAVLRRHEWLDAKVREVKTRERYD